MVNTLKENEAGKRVERKELFRKGLLCIFKVILMYLIYCWQYNLHCCAFVFLLKVGAVAMFAMCGLLTAEVLCGLQALRARGFSSSCGAWASY